MKWTHTAAFEHFRTKPRNVYWSWSARSEDGKTVVVTLWQDEIKRSEKGLVYSRQKGQVSDTRPGMRELMENLAWARDNCEGKVSVIIAIAKNINANERSIAECFPSKMTMQLEELNISDQTFTLKALGL